MTASPATASDSPTPPNKLLPPALFRQWTHSREEDRAGVEVYRPDGYTFPPSHGLFVERRNTEVPVHPRHVDDAEQFQPRCLVHL